MYVIELRFTDDPRRLDARPAHRDRLTALNATGRLVLAGPFADDSGALLVFRDDPADELAADPYYATPGVTVAGVREWRPVVGG
ncbi:MAG TPA: YciI family protein [Actinophytocola sp.]|nr:YciI family protein [Actinophytocola sp.]